MRRGFFRVGLLGRVVATVLLGSSVGWAQDPGAVASARELATEGLAAYDAGHYEIAAVRLRQAYQIVRVPAVALHLALSLEKSGRWVEASEIYLETTRLTASGTDSNLQQQARDRARAAREALLPRIPRVRVRVENARPEDVAVHIDETLIPSSLLSAGWLVDPGPHRVTGEWLDENVTQLITLKPSDEPYVTLRFGHDTEAVPPPTVAAAPPQRTPPTPPPVPASSATVPVANSGPTGGPRAEPTTLDPTAPDRTSLDHTPTDRARKTGAYVALGVGAGGLVLGTATASMLASLKGKLDSGDCDGETCGPDEYDRVDRYNALRPVSTTGFVIAGVGVATGVALLATAPRGDRDSSVSLWVGARSAGIAGTFR